MKEKKIISEELYWKYMNFLVEKGDKGVCIDFVKNYSYMQIYEDPLPKEEIEKLKDMVFPEIPQI